MTVGYNYNKISVKILIYSINLAILGYLAVISLHDGMIIFTIGKSIFEAVHYLEANSLFKLSFAGGSTAV